MRVELPGPALEDSGVTDASGNLSEEDDGGSNEPDSSLDDSASSAPDSSSGLDSAPDRNRICHCSRPRGGLPRNRSTGCDQYDTAFAGWGHWLPQYFTSPVSIANYGNSGVNTPGFTSGSHYWPTIQQLITPKDFLLIELGDNDKSDSASAIKQGLITTITGAGRRGPPPS
jgi:hypothetical protein